jgi:hypothetical protein
MNRRVVLFHLREAAEQLNRTVSDLERCAAYDDGLLEAAMGHIYHHLNTAWNGRNQTDKQFRDCFDHDFIQFQKFPKETEFGLLSDYREVESNVESGVAPKRLPAQSRKTRTPRRRIGR